MAVTYALRAVGDLAEPDPSVLSWLSPIGWNQQIRAFAGDRWWVLVLPVSLCLVLVPAAFVLRARRDLGAGLRAERPGPAVGSLSGVWDLAVRLQYRVLLAWAVAFVVFGVVIGSLASNVEELLSSPNAQDLIKLMGGRQALTEAFLARGDQHHGGAGGRLWGVVREPPAQRGGCGPHRSPAGDGDHPGPPGRAATSSLPWLGSLCCCC